VKKRFFFFVLIFFSFAAVMAQSILDIDLGSFDSLFDEPLSDNTEQEEAAVSVLDNVRRRGLSVTASYEFQGIVAPGWDMPPWYFNGDEVFSWGQGVKMASTLSIDAQISEVFRVLTNVRYNIPGFYFYSWRFLF